MRGRPMKNGKIDFDSLVGRIQTIDVGESGAKGQSLISLSGDGSLLAESGDSLKTSHAENAKNAEEGVVK